MVKEGNERQQLAKFDQNRDGADEGGALVTSTPASMSHCGIDTIMRQFSELHNMSNVC